MKQVNPNIYPKGGYFYLERDGARIGGDSWAGVIKRVDIYRRRAHYPVGDPRTDVMSQACQRNPGLCSEGDAVYQQQLSRTSLKTRVLMWFARVIAGRAADPPVFVSEQDFRNRAAVCSGCSNNTPLPEGCSSCRAAVEESRRNIIGSRGWDARMNSCVVLGEDLNTAGWLDRQRVENGELPGHCWQKRQL